MGRYDKTGKKRVFYVNEKMFANSVHGNLRCKSCHVGLDKIPHTDIKKVDCSTKCHIEEPSTNKEFSHINMIQKYEASGSGNTLFVGEKGTITADFNRHSTKMSDGSEPDHLEQFGALRGI